MLAYNPLAYLPGVQPGNITENVQSHMRSAADLMPRQHKTPIVAAFPSCSVSSEQHVGDGCANTASKDKSSSQSSSAPLYRGEVTEVYGISGSSKTEHTYNAVLSVVLPQHLTNGEEQLVLNSTLTAGTPSRAVVIDLDGRYSVQRLVQLISARVEQALHTSAAKRSTTEHADKVEQYLNSKLYLQWLESVLKSITVMHCASAEEFAAALLMLEQMCKQYNKPGKATLAAVADVSQPHASQPASTVSTARQVKAVALVVIDGIAADYWSLRSMPEATQVVPLTADPMMIEGTEARVTKPNSNAAVYRFYGLVADRLHALAKVHGFTALVTKAVIFHKHMRALELDWCHYEYLGDQYSNHIAQRIILQQDQTDELKGKFRSLTVARLDSNSSASAMRHVARWSFTVSEHGLHAIA